jgi:hypothetical protein
MRRFATSIPISGILSFALFIMALQRTTEAAEGPCDIYARAGTPCVAAHSTVRALYAEYNGPLYQIKRKSDNQTKDVPLLSKGGYVNAAVIDTFQKGTTGTVSIIYDQSEKKNDMPVSPPVLWLKNGGTPVIANDGKAVVNGHQVYGIKVYPDASGPGMGGGGNSYRNNQAKGLATGDQPEAMYMVADAKYYNGRCCFDYGNVETSGQNDGNATMETIEYGNMKTWSYGSGSGPWILIDLENGVFAGGQTSGMVSVNTSIVANAFVSLMVKGPSGNKMTLKAGDAQTGALATKYDGARPPGYNPMKKRGGVELGTGGDGSSGGCGIFYEGAITFGVPPDSIDNAVQANIVAAGYGSTVTSTRNSAMDAVSPSFVKVKYNPSNGSAVFSYALQRALRVSANIFDQQGRRVAELASGIMPAGRNTTVWDAKRVRAGVYVCRISIDGVEGWTGKIIVGK